MSISYVRQRGLPISRIDRPYFTWFGDMELLPHIWGVLMRTPIDIAINIGEPHRFSDYKNRKELTRQLETDVKTHGVVVAVGAATGRTGRCGVQYPSGSKLT